MAKLKVFDRKNPDRFLGTLIWDRPFTSPYLSVACMPRMSMTRVMHSASKVSSMEFTKADFKVEWEHETKADNWHTRIREERMILLTDTPLETLLMIEKFMLPGEDATDAYRRVHDFY